MLSDAHSAPTEPVKHARAAPYDKQTKAEARRILTQRVQASRKVISDVRTIETARGPRMLRRRFANGGAIGPEQFSATTTIKHKL